MGRLGGISAEGLFGGVEAWVDRKKAPGFSDQTSALSAATTAKNALQLKHFYQSPNLVWFAIAFAMHVVVPYDIAAAKSGFAASWCGARTARRAVRLSALRPLLVCISMEAILRNDSPRLHA